MPQTTHCRPRPHTYRNDNVLIDEYARRIGPIGVAVYNVLSRHADRESGRCRIGISKISFKLNISRTSVKKYLHLLFTHGLIAIIPQYRQQGGQTINHYLLLDLSPEGRKRRQAQFDALLQGSTPDVPHRESPRDLPPSTSNQTTTGGRSGADPIQESFCQDILPTTQEADLPAIQQTCPHPAREVTRLFDGITICHRCYKQLDTDASETFGKTPPASLSPEAPPDPSAASSPRRPLVCAMADTWRHFRQCFRSVT